MNDKRGQGISMEFIIIAAIALVVLIVIILFFTGGIQKLLGQAGGVAATATDRDKELWTSECKTSCVLGGANPYFFCTHIFEVKNDKGEITETWVCNQKLFKGTGGTNQKSLDIECKEIEEKKLCDNVKV